MMVLVDGDQGDGYITRLFVSITSGNKILVLPIRRLFCSSRRIGQLNKYLHDLQTINNGCYITITMTQASRMCVAAILKLHLPPSLHKGL